MEPALDGVEAAFLLWPQASAEGHAATVELLAARVQRIVYVSSLTVRDDLDVQTHPMTVIHADIERTIQRAGGGWTFLRSGKFDTNALGWAPQIRETGAVRFPYPEAGRSPVHELDVAAVAARALTQEGLVGKKLVVTGPEALTEAEIVAAIGEAIGRGIRVERVDPGASRREMLEAGVSAELADAALDYWELLTREPEPVSGVVAEVTGRPGRTFGEWVAQHADAFV